jgi:hypothetical protein
VLAKLATERIPDASGATTNVQAHRHCGPAVLMRSRCISQCLAINVVTFSRCSSRICKHGARLADYNAGQVKTK